MVGTSKKSEFAGDLERVCRTKGHIVTRPHPQSSYWRNVGSDKFYCERCRKWFDSKEIGV